MVEFRASFLPVAGAKTAPGGAGRAVGASVAYLVTFAVALCGGAIFHADLPAARRLVLAGVNAVLSTPFKGTIVLENVAELHVGGAGGVDAHLLGADGSTIAFVRGARARVHPVALLRSVLSGAGDVQVGVLGVQIDFADVSLDADASGQLKLQTAFEPRTPPAGGPASAGRSVVVELPNIDVRRSWVHGQMKGFPAIDAELDALRGSVRVDRAGAFIDVTHAGLVARAMPQAANPVGAAEVHIAIPSRTGRPFGLDAAFDGTIAGIPSKARAALDGDLLDAVLDVPEVSDDKVRAFLPQAPIHRPAAAHVEGHGPLHSLTATARLTTGSAEATATGRLTLDGRFGATIAVDVRNVNLREMVLTAPDSNLSLHGDVRIETTPAGTLFGNLAVAVPGGEIGGQPVPAATMQGDFAQLSASSPGARAQSAGIEIKLQGLVAEPGAPTNVHLTLRTDGAAPVLRFQASNTVSWLDNVKRVGGLGPGRARAQLAGTMTFSAPISFDATLDADVQALEHPPLASDEARVTAHAYGTFDDATVTALIDADGLRAASYGFGHARLTAAGPLSAERVTVTLEGGAGPSVRAAATVSLASALRLQNVEVDLSRGSRALRAVVKEVRVEPHGVRVVDALVTGIGEPATVSFDTRRGLLIVHGRSNGIDLGALGYLLGIENTLRDGRLAFAVDLAARPDGSDGSATAELERGSFGSVDGLSGHVEATMDGRQITGAMTATMRGVAWLNATEVDVHIGGNGPLEAGSWRRAWGGARVDGQIDLGKAAALLPPDTLPFSRLDGQLTLQAHVRRDDEKDVTPDVAIALKTSGLRVTPQRRPDQSTGGTTLVAAPPWEMTGIDVQIDAQADGQTGFAEIAGRIVDKEGLLLSLDAKSTSIPYGRLFGSSDVALDILKDTPFSALAIAPRRRLDRVPSILHPEGASGEAEARVAIEGTARKPVVDASAVTYAARLAASPLARGLDASLGMKYDGVRATFGLDGKAGRSGDIHVKGRVNANVEDFFSLGMLAPWDASATAMFDRFPLGAIAALNERQVRGQITGRVELANWRKDARAVADLDVTDLVVVSSKPISGKVHVTLDGQALDAQTRLEQGGAFVVATAHAGTRWGTSLAPSVDTKSPAAASLQARSLPASFFAPFATSVLDELDGVIDADARIALAPDKKPEMSGALSLRDGLIEVTSLGQEFHAVQGRLRLTPDGVLRLEDVSASATTGRATASGVAHLDGLALVDAEMAVTIDRREAIPLDLQGSALGTVYGRFDLKAATSPDRQALKIDVAMPSLHVALPETSTHAVQDLDPAEPETHAGVYVAPGKFVVLPLDGFDAQQQELASTPATIGKKLTVTVHLGEDVQVDRGADLRVDMDGDLVANVAGAIDVTGRIQLKGGKLDVQGKSFEIQSGTATFLGDPSNPEVNVTAAWTASDGTRVYAEYIGPLKTGKVVLRSEPMRPQNEILALVLFGSADGLAPSASSSQQSSSTAQSAGTTVGSFASGGLSKGLDKLTGMQITAKVDTSQAYTRPEVAVQIARDISLQIAVVLGAPGGVDTTLATIDWRFLKNWSLETTVGNLGTSIADVVWQHRY
ncbi:MAG: translocation/assembly module TamB [Myxococcota bacterium]|nr:translocation/assembly module TamB [Myxococcota bacterium]